jgi:hypothetical protein
MLSLDSSSEPIEHGPRGYIGVVGNLLPGWTIALLALSFLVPVALAAGVGLASAARSPIEAARGVVWTTLRSLPFLGALAMLSFGILVGLVPSPEFPFDPRTEGLGLVGGISVAVVALAYATIAFFLRPLRPPPRDATSSAAPAALLVAWWPPRGSPVAGWSPPGSSWRGSCPWRRCSPTWPVDSMPAWASGRTSS